MRTKPSFSEMHEIWSLESCLEKRLLDASCLHLKASVVVVSLECRAHFYKKYDLNGLSFWRKFSVPLTYLHNIQHRVINVRQ